MDTSFDPICLKTLCSLSPPIVMLHIKFDQDWPTVFRDIQVWKCWQRRTDDGPLVYYKLTLWAFGSGELNIWGITFFKSFLPLRNYGMDYQFSGNNGNMLSRCIWDNLKLYISSLENWAANRSFGQLNRSCLLEVFLTKWKSSKIPRAGCCLDQGLVTMIITHQTYEQLTATNKISEPKTYVLTRHFLFIKGSEWSIQLPYWWHQIRCSIKEHHIDGTKSGVLSQSIMMPIIDMPTTINQAEEEQGR